MYWTDPSLPRQKMDWGVAMKATEVHRWMPPVRTGLSV